MTVSIFLGSMALLSILALWQRVWIKVIWGSAGKNVKVSYLMIHFRMPQEPAKKKKRDKKQKRNGSRMGSLRWTDLAPELFQAISRGSKFLLRHSELRHLRLEGEIGLEDVANTGQLWGTVQAVYWLLQPWRSNFELAVTPTFDVDSTRLTLDVEGTVRLAILGAASVIILWHLPKQKLWRLLREPRPRQKYASHQARLKEVKRA
jgi:hypothetical protein